MSETHCRPTRFLTLEHPVVSRPNAMYNIDRYLNFSFSTFLKASLLLVVRESYKTCYIII